ncbi:hypothetical protein WDU94_000137 [Cyamophila willieti]
MTKTNDLFLARLRYILSYIPDEGNTTKKRGRKTKSTPSCGANGNHSDIIERINSSLFEVIGRKRLEDGVNFTETAEMKSGDVGHFTERDEWTAAERDLESMEDRGREDITPQNLELERRAFVKQTPEPRELTSYEFNMMMEKHGNTFLEPDFTRDNPLHPYIANNKIQSILGLTDDWQLFSDNRKSRYSFPITDLQKNSSLLKPDLLLLSDKLKYMLIVELTIPWDFNMVRQSNSKAKKYRTLIRDLNAKKYNVHFFTIEVGLTGNVGTDLEVLFKQIGLDRSSRKRYLAEISNTTLDSSVSIWNRKRERKWKFWIFWKKRNQEKYRRKHVRSRGQGKRGGKT